MCCPNLKIFNPKHLNVCLGLLLAHWLYPAKHGFLGCFFGDVVFVFYTTSFWAKFLMFIPSIWANDILTPLQHCSPSATSHTLTLQKCMIFPGGEESKLFFYQPKHQKPTQ